MQLEMEAATTDPWKQDLDKFKAYLERFKVNIDKIVDRGHIEKELERNRKGYSRDIEIKYIDRKEIADGEKPWSHGFNFDEESRNTTQLEIAQDLKEALVHSGDERKLKDFESHLYNLVDAANHDFTAHAVGIDGGSEVIKELEEVVDFTREVEASGAFELMAAMSHRILFEKACEQNPTLKKLVLRQAREAMKDLQSLAEKDRAELASAVQYFVYYLISPEDSELEPLRARFSGASFTAFPKKDKWGQAIHQNRFKLKGSEKYVTDMDLFKILYSNPMHPREIIKGVKKSTEDEIKKNYREKIKGQIDAVAK